MTLCVQAQNHKSSDTLNLINGVWNVCTNTQFSTNYHCTTGWTSYTFYENGNFVEMQKEGNWNGSYKFKGNYLSIKRNGIRTKTKATTTVMKFGKNIYKIIWLDKNRFYSVSEKGPEGIVYTYFERTP